MGSSELGGLAAPVPAYVVERLRKLMRVNPILSQSVVFVGIKTERGFAPVGTGWLVASRFEEHLFQFVATASHVWETLPPQSQQSLVARANRKDGPAGYIHLNPASCYKHQNAANDVSLFAVNADWTVYDCISWEMDRANIESVREDAGGVCPGDPVCAIGLYTSHYGEVSNKPVVRTGNVAAIADEPIWSERGFVEAHLIELRTIAGLSGSPVFQTFGPVRIRDGMMQHNSQDTSGGVPLGMLIGYHVVQSKEDQITVPQQGEEPVEQMSGPSLDQRNTGFGLVIPVERIMEIFDGLAPLFAAHIAAKKAASTVIYAASPGSEGSPSAAE